MIPITINKLRIFQRYNGDEDMFLRTGKENEKQLFCHNEWHLIDNCLQSIAMIKIGLVTEQFAVATLRNLAEITDQSSFEMLLS